MDEREKPEFDVNYDGEPSNTLVVGIPEIGMAGLTSVQYINEQLGLKETGYVTNEDLPSITPFDGGAPRHHTRFFSRDDVGVTTLVAELPVPPWASRSFADTLLEWTDTHGVSEVVFLSGVHVRHDETEHQVYYVATEDYHERRLKETDVEPMSGGFLEGFSAEVVQRGIDSPLAVAVYATPVHAVAQDVEAALRLLSGFNSVYELDIDVGPLKEYADQVNEYHAKLYDHMRERNDAVRPVEDRMFM